VTPISTVHQMERANLTAFSHRNCFFSPAYRSANKSLARPTSRCNLFDSENISFDAILVIYINSTNIRPIMIINRIYEHQNLVAVACFLPGRAKDLSAPLNTYSMKQSPS
jgi:hypothetical protein